MNLIPKEELDLSEQMRALEEEGNKVRREEGGAETYIDKHLKAADIARYIGEPNVSYDNKKKVGRQLMLLADSSEGLEKLSYGIRSIKQYFQAGKAAERNKDFSKSLKFYKTAADVAYMSADSKPGDERQEWYNLIDYLHLHTFGAAKEGNEVMEAEKVKERRRNLRSKMTIDNMKEAPTELPFDIDYLF